MYKLPKVALILEPDVTKASIYNGALESSGYIVKVEHNETDFFQMALQIIPDVLVVNGTHDDVSEDAVCKKIVKHPILREMGSILLVPKINFAAKAKLEKLKIDALEEYPLQNKNFLLSIKQVSKKLIIPGAMLEENNTIKGMMHIDLLEISDTNFTFSAPVKLHNHAQVEIHSNLLERFGVVSKNFEADINGSYYESKMYKNEVEFRGISVEVLKEIKKYCTSNREKS